MPADTTFYFAQPLALWVLPLSLVTVAVLLWKRPNFLLPWHAIYTSLTRQRYRHPLLPQLVSATAKQNASAVPTHYSRLLAYSVFLILLHLSLAQPFHYGQKIPVPPPQRDIVFVVDTSVSMLLRDYLVNDQRTERIIMLKGVLDHFIQQLHGNRLAVVAFSEQPYTFVPLTNDYTLLRYQIQRLEPAVLTGRSSDVSLALLYSARQFTHVASEPPLLVLITDATRPNRHIDPRAAARYLSQQHYHLHVVGIGAASYAAEDTTLQGLVYHPINMQLLQDIAAAGSGRFFWARNTAQLHSALDEIQRAEQRPVNVAAEYIPLPLYQWPLLLAVVWLCGWQILPLVGRSS